MSPGRIILVILPLPMWRKIVESLAFGNYMLRPMHRCTAPLEPSTGPLDNSVDRLLIHRIHKNKLLLQDSLISRELVWREEE